MHKKKKTTAMITTGLTKIKSIYFMVRPAHSKIREKPNYCNQCTTKNCLGSSYAGNLVLITSEMQKVLM